MFTIKIYADGHTFIRSATSIEIINYDSANYQELCLDLKKDYLASGILDDFIPNESELEIEDQKEHYLETLLPYSFLFYESEGNSNKWYFHGGDTGYIVNDRGQTIETIKAPSAIAVEIKEE